jgi:DNA-binding NarL/FixJ family response regulator
MTRVIIVDDQTIVREGLVLLLQLLPDIYVAGAAASGAEALRMVATERPDVVLMDLRMPKMDGAGEIAEAIAAVRRGEAQFDPAIQRRLAESVASRSPASEALPDGLTPREIDVLRLIAAGQSNMEIAKELVITEATVKTHINNLFAKAGVRDRAQAVTYAFRHGIARPN